MKKTDILKIPAEAIIDEIGTKSIICGRERQTARRRSLLPSDRRQNGGDRFRISRRRIRSYFKARTILEDASKVVVKWWKSWSNYASASPLGVLMLVLFVSILGFISFIQLKNWTSIPTFNSRLLWPSHQIHEGAGPEGIGELDH